MSKWRPDLNLKLEGANIIVEGPHVADDEKFFGPIEYDLQITTLCQDLVEWLGLAAGSNTGKGDRRRATQEVEIVGSDIFSVIFNLWNKKCTKRLRDILARALGTTNEHPCTIVFEGIWYAFPWEALAVPSDVHGGVGTKFLGELAIISSIRAPQHMFDKNPFVVGVKLQIVSMKGQTSLPYCTQEIQQVAAYAGAYIQPHRVVSGLVANGHWHSEQKNCDNIKRLMYQHPPVDFLHGAFHSPTPPNSQKFAIDLDKNFRLNSSNISRSNANIEHSNIAFFNTCQGLTAHNKWNSGGLAEYASTYWISNPIITSICKINDKAACEFSKLLLDRILPTTGPSGAMMGRALYDVRRIMLSKSGPERLIGLSYRLIGSPVAYIEISADEAA